eukprot:TRINITY_DN54689_c0_g1_i1.p1 TRINITY_DN54689_c0_g1~~TRINITY_DN54689_c0_g1_i1.p1  ORF type:complete len:184 (-),score=19.57 TRINITY_DN54689_c0_g1_i1:80-586(-)
MATSEAAFVVVPRGLAAPAIPSQRNLRCASCSGDAPEGVAPGSLDFTTKVAGISSLLVLGRQCRVGSARARRCRTARRGAPPGSIWQTSHGLQVAELNRAWLLPYTPGSEDEEPAQAPVGAAAPLGSQSAPRAESLPQALLRFLGGSVLLAVLAQAGAAGGAARGHAS